MDNGKNYSSEQREAVYRVWAFETNRSALATANRIRDDEDMKALGVSDVSDRTIRRWANEEDWASRANQELYRVAPELRLSAQATLALAAPEAADELRKMLTVEVYVDTPIVVKNEDGSTRIEWVRQLDKDLLKAKMTAIQLTLDRSGFSPIGTRDLGEMAAPKTVREALATLIMEASPEELAALEDQVKQGAGIGTLAIGLGQGRSRG